MKISLTIVCIILLLVQTSQAVQVAFFRDDLNPDIKLEGEFTHVAISYQGKWLHAHPSYINGRLTAFPGVHITQNLTQIGLNFVVFENPFIEEPNEEFYNKFKDRKFNLLAEWNSQTETHCSILIGKHLKIKPTRMKFKSSFWRDKNVGGMRGKLGLSPKEIYSHISKDANFELYYESPFSKFKSTPRSVRCSHLFRL